MFFEGLNFPLYVVVMVVAWVYKFTSYVLHHNFMFKSMKASLSKILNLGLNFNSMSVYANLVNDITIYGSPLIFISSDKHIWELTVLCYHYKMEIYHYPFLW